MTPLRIPLLNSTTDQTLDLTISNNPYTLRVLWNDRFEYFSLSILDLNQEPILTNVKMVKNYPLIGQFKNTRLPRGEFYFIDERQRLGDRPGYDDLGVNYNLYYVEPELIVTAAAQVIEISAPVIGSVWDSGLSEWESGTLWDQ